MVPPVPESGRVPASGPSVPVTINEPAPVALRTIPFAPPFFAMLSKSRPPEPIVVPVTLTAVPVVEATVEGPLRNAVALAPLPLPPVNEPVDAEPEPAPAAVRFTDSFLHRR